MAVAILRRFFRRLAERKAGGAGEFRKAIQAFWEQMEGMPAFQAWKSDPTIVSYIELGEAHVCWRGGQSEPGFSMFLIKQVEREWFVRLVELSAAGDHEGLKKLAETAPTDSAKLWCLNPPACNRCGGVLPHHRQDCIFTLKGR